MLASAETEVIDVDNYSGPATLDCLVDVGHPIKLLTGAATHSIAEGFDRVLADFRAEGREIEVRRHAHLHDRHLVFNGRCWLLGSSIKDAEKKGFNLIEIVDSRLAIVSDINRKWEEGKPFCP